MLPLSRTAKPPYRTPIDWTHPLATNLLGFWPLNEGAGPAWDLVSGLMLTQGAGSRWSSTGTMPGLNIASQTSQAQATAPQQLQLAGPLTIAMGFRQVAAPANNNGMLGGVIFNSTFGTPFYSYALQFNSSLTNIAFLVNTGGTLRTITGAVVAAGGDYVLSASHTAGAQKFYQAGAQVGTASNAGNPTYGTGPVVAIGSASAVNRNPNILPYWMAIWGRVLSPAAHFAIGASPTAIFEMLTPTRILFPKVSAYSLVTSAGSYSLTGQSSNLLFGRKLTASAGSYGLSGASASLLLARKLTASAGSYVLSGQAAGLSFGYTLVASAGSYGLSGHSASLLAARKLVASAGSYGLSGQAANLLATRKLVAAAGSYGLAGSAASPSFGYALTAAAGSYGLAGQAASLDYLYFQTFRQALYARLGAIPKLTAIVGTSIYPGALPITHDFDRDGPALTYTVLTYPRGKVLSGSDGTATARVQLSAWSYSESTSDSIVRAVWNALDGVYNDSGWGNGTIVIMSSIRTEEVDLPDEPISGSEEWIHQIPVEYSIKHRTRIPTNT